MAVYRHPPSNLTEFERICQEELEEKSQNPGVESLLHHTQEDPRL